MQLRVTRQTLVSAVLYLVSLIVETGGTGLAVVARCDGHRRERSKVTPHPIRTTPTSN
ncbi:hypothetical protein NITLEN_20056 [Nitrospira lenta]|uniref:Uncharacterized protein n=1 Tax=Nitrospira lenta TaxID=1436998 RepID=A0A330L3Z2_9BACT|nr:hypothetical protein NITLEN_20056 [Nitrospira lenta]